MVLVLFIGAVGAFTVGCGLYATGLFGPTGMSAEENQSAWLVFTTIGLVLGTAAVPLWVQVVARRGPALRACREGLEVRLFGLSRVYGVPSARPVSAHPGVRLGAVVPAPDAALPWEALAGVSMSDDEFERILDIQWRPEPAGDVCEVALPQSEIAAPVGKVAESLLSWSRDESARASLPGWEDQA